MEEKKKEGGEKAREKGKERGREEGQAVEGSEI